MRSTSQFLRRRAAIGRLLLVSVLALASLAAAPAARATVQGLNGPSFALEARAGTISTPDGASIYSWGYGVGGVMQIPGPTLIVNEGDTVSVALTNALPLAAGNVSIVFPGHEVSATGGVQGLLTQEAPTGGTVNYSFVASRPGTYVYHSGTRADLQVEMGLSGTLIVRSATAG